MDLVGEGDVQVGRFGEDVEVPQQLAHVSGRGKLEDRLEVFAPREPVEGDGAGEVAVAQPYVRGQLEQGLQSG